DGGERVLGRNEGVLYLPSAADRHYGRDDPAVDLAVGGVLVQHEIQLELPYRGRHPTAALGHDGVASRVQRAQLPGQIVLYKPRHVLQVLEEAESGQRTAEF